MSVMGASTQPEFQEAALPSTRGPSPHTRKVILDRLDALRRHGSDCIARCPAHDDRNPSLSIKQGEDGRVLVYCHAGCSVESICAALGIAKRDLFADAQHPGRGPLRARRRVRAIPTSNPSRDMAQIAGRFQAALDPRRLRAVSNRLAVSEPSLRRLGIGQAGSAVSFPVHDSDGSVCGIQLRYPDDTKRFLKESRQGLFLPSGLRADGQLLVCEGASDTAAILDLGFDAIGRPSCSGGAKLVAAFVQSALPKQIVIVADADGPGRRGAIHLAVQLRVLCPSVCVIEPGNGARDARVWVIAGATAEDVRAAIEAAEPVQIEVCSQRRTGA